jgi:voltage-gated potassium channel
MRGGRRHPRLDRQRDELLRQLEDWLEVPMLVLGFVWLVLLVIELVWGLTPLLETLGTFIWGVFVVDFAVKFFLAPDKLAYLKSNWLTVLALVVPALRVFRIVRVLRVLRVARAARGVRLFRVVSSLNRGLKALRATMGRRGFGYVLALIVLITGAGAAGMYALERDAPGGGFKSFGEALWWTAMLMTTLGSEYWPQTAEGRLLTFLLALVAFGVFGYVTATLATFFLGRDADSRDTEIVSARDIEALREEIRALREEVRALSEPGRERAGRAA